ncbi:MAG: ROK family protein [Beijerinckiaceae bacterium]|nr:ROK family protein [Beijerinckiaceae bacterium]
MSQSDDTQLIRHGASKLPLLSVDSYNLDVKEGKEIVNTRIKKSIFTEKFDALRQRLEEAGGDPIGNAPTSELSKKQMQAILEGEDREAAAVLNGVMESFAQDFAAVIKLFLAEKAWKGVERLVVGGGFKEGEVGLRTIARTAIIARENGVAIPIVPIRHHSDEAGLIGAVHLIPSWMLKGHDALLAVDIGGTNIRAGIVVTMLDEANDFSKARVLKSELWRHADDSPKRTQTVETLIDMLESLKKRAEKEGLNLAPVIGVGCPGVIEADGSIARGGVNLPGGNWESGHFNLPRAVVKGIASIGEHETFVIMHNDAVVQGLSQAPFMQDVKRWGVMTIGTGLGNACFTNAGAS